MNRYLALRLARLGTMAVALAALVAVLLVPRLATVFICVMLAGLIASLVLNVLLRQELVRRLDQVRAQNGGALPVPPPGAMRRALLGPSIGITLALTGIVVLAILVPELRVPALITVGVLVIVVPLAFWRTLRRYGLLRRDPAATESGDGPSTR